MRYNDAGAAVMLCDPASIFPSQLAAYWRAKGHEVVYVTLRPDLPPTAPDGGRTVRSCDYETRLTRSVTYRLMNPVLDRLERRLPRFKARFSRRTGLSAETQLWMSHFAEYVKGAWPAARAALAQRPRFVFGHEVTAYGLATALCRGVPRIIFPWGGDVFTYAESSPYHAAMVKLALWGADLVVPSATTAARHIRERFGLPPEKVRAVSWGVDRQMFKKADPEQRKAVCARWGIDPAAKVFLNARRFRPVWGCFVALEAFMQLAVEHPSSHFILLGGEATEEFMRQAGEAVAGRGLRHRFTLLEGNAPLDVCAELMSVSDVFLSLLGRGDMRSSSVLQAAASGGVPVVSDNAEYREMQQQGFAALYVRNDSVEDVLGALRFLLHDPEEAGRMVARNEVYIAEHEDHPAQMDKLLEMIDGVCASYAGVDMIPRRRVGGKIR